MNFNVEQIFSVLPIIQQPKAFFPATITPLVLQSFQWLVWACFALEILPKHGSSCEITTLSSFSMPSFYLLFILIEETAEKQVGYDE